MRVGACVCARRVHEYVRVVLMRVRVFVYLCVCARALRIGPRTIGKRGCFYV